MNKTVKKSIIFTLLYTLIITLLPSVSFQHTVEAATDLKTIELNNPYNVIEAVQYKEKTFIIGNEINEPIEKIRVSVREGNKISDIIPDSEIRKTIQQPVDWINRQLHVLQDTTNKLYIASGSYVFTVDKNTNQYQKQTEEEFLAPFIQVLKKNGYINGYTKEMVFDKDGLAWVVAAKEDENGCIFVNKNGTSKVIEKAPGYVRGYLMNIKADANGNLYYVDDLNHKLTMIDPNGKVATYNIPEGFVGLLFIDQNNNMYMNESFAFNIGVFKIEHEQLQLIKTFPRYYLDFKQDNNGQIWYMKSVDGIKHLNYVYGYVDKQLNFNDVYTTTSAEQNWPSYDIYDKNIVVYTNEGFGTSVQSQPLKGWVQKNGNWYYHSPQTGSIQTGWLNDNGTWYYFNGSGVMQSGWQLIGGVWYYFSGSGAMQSNWQSIGGVWYYFSESGAMQSGWQSINGTWYYFSGSGAMQSGWQSINGAWYYFSGSGAMQSGWQSINGAWYYFSGSGTMQSGWQLIGGKWYYFYSGGQMAANTTIDGYKLGPDGTLR